MRPKKYSNIMSCRMSNLRSSLARYLPRLGIGSTKIRDNRYFIKEGYRSRAKSDYFRDSSADAEGIVHQPDVYPFAGYLARRFGCTHIIDIGCGRAQKLVSLQPEFRIIGVDFGANIRYCRERYRTGEWIEWDLENAQSIPLRRNVIRRAVIICSDVIEHLVDPQSLVVNLRSWLDYAPFAIVTTPERDLVRGPNDLGPPANTSHVREWNLTELEQWFKFNGLNILFSGLTVNNNRNLEKKTSMIVLGRGSTLVFTSAPAPFRVVAFMTAYNEADIIVPAISRLIAQGVEVYLIDNWSTDNTVENASQLLGKGLIAIEKFPSDGPPRYYEWTRLLGRVEELANRLSADWFIHHDADEIRESPWAGVTLKDAVYLVDRSGFNAIDHTVVVFPPVDNDFVPGDDFGSYFSYFDFGRRPTHFSQMKVWKNLRCPIRLANSGGHEAEFAGRRVYPFKFLLKHYPIRSQTHGDRKIFTERVQRFSPEERAKGWHLQYDSLIHGQVFLKRPSELARFEQEQFFSHYLVERLSGIGVVRVREVRKSVQGEIVTAT